MTFYTISSDAIQPLNFFDIITVPPENSAQNFISVSDIKIDPSSILSGQTALDARGVVTFKLHFYIDTEKAKENSLREIKFDLYTEDPTPRTYSETDLEISDPGLSTSLSTISRTARSPIVSPIRTFTISIPSNIQGQTYDIIVNNSTNNGLPVSYESASSPTAILESLSSSTSLFESERNILRRVLINSLKDPTDYLNWRYFNTLDSVSPAYAGLSIVDMSRQFTSANYISLSSGKRQTKLSQKSPDSFIKNSDIDVLYRSSITNTENKTDNLPKKILVSSKIKEYQVFFNIEMSALNPATLTRLFVNSQILDANNNIRANTQSVVNFTQQIQGHITPAVPPSLSVSSQADGFNILSVSQNDYLANIIAINKMIINPNQPKSRITRWIKLIDLPVSVADGVVTYIDRRSADVIYPNIIVYEAISVSSLGARCPVSKKVILAGKRRNIGAQRSSRAETHCSITAYQDQENNKISIIVGDIPPNMSRITLRRQTMTTAVRQNDSRYHKVIKTISGDLFYKIGSKNLEYEFEDTDLQDRCVYRYYVEFDNSAGIRTESALDEIIEFRRPPSKKIYSALRFPKLPNVINKHTEFDLIASFRSEVLQSLNNMLTSRGISDLFKADIKTDRSRLSSLLFYEVSRKNTRTGDRITWPIVNTGRFIDSESSRTPIGKTDDALIPGDTYIYTARLLMMDPEALFTSSTTTTISADGLQNIQLSAKKFAENFSIAPGKMQSPTTYSRLISRGITTSTYFTGISHTLVVKTPLSPTDIQNVRAIRSTMGRPANIISWKIPDDNVKENIFCFRIDVVTNKENISPLMSVSPNSTIDGISYEVRDEINVNKVVPVQYIVSTIKSDMSRDAGVITQEIDNESSYPREILNKLISKSQ